MPWKTLCKFEPRTYSEYPGLPLCVQTGFMLQIRPWFKVSLFPVQHIYQVVPICSTLSAIFPTMMDFQNQWRSRVEIGVVFCKWRLDFIFSNTNQHAKPSVYCSMNLGTEITGEGGPVSAIGICPENPNSSFQLTPMMHAHSIHKRLLPCTISAPWGFGFPFNFWRKVMELNFHFVLSVAFELLLTSLGPFDNEFIQIFWGRFSDHDCVSLDWVDSWVVRNLEWYTDLHHQDLVKIRIQLCEHWFKNRSRCSWTSLP